MYTWSATCAVCVHVDVTRIKIQSLVSSFQSSLHQQHIHSIPRFYSNTSSNFHQIPIAISPIISLETQWYAYLGMSFQDLESGRRNQINGKQNPTQAVASGVFQINTAVSTFQRLVNTLGTPKDTPELREKLWEIAAPLYSLSLNRKFCLLLQF